MSLGKGVRAEELDPGLHSWIKSLGTVLSLQLRRRSSVWTLLSIQDYSSYPSATTKPLVGSDLFGSNTRAPGPGWERTRPDVCQRSHAWAEVIYFIFSGARVSAQKATAPPCRRHMRTSSAAVLWCSEDDNAERGCLLQPWSNLLLCLSLSGDSFIAQWKHEEQYHIQKRSSPTQACSFPGLFPCLSQQRGPHTLWCWFFLPYICSFYRYPICCVRRCLPLGLPQNGAAHPGPKACTQTCCFADFFLDQSLSPWDRGCEYVSLSWSSYVGKAGAGDRTVPLHQHHVYWQRGSFTW